ncbi:alkene reductase, partial [Escherichia coli]|nr:alkene reductase [Escherichia coli]
MTYTLKDDSPLLKPFDSGVIHTPHRVFMAPLTRLRAESDGTPTDLQTEYYRQRA